MVAKDHKARRPKFHSVLWLCNPQRTKPPEGGCQRYYAPSPPPLSTLVIVVRPPHRVLRFYSCSFLRLQRGTVTGTVTGTGPRFHKSQPQESVCATVYIFVRFAFFRHACMEVERGFWHKADTDYYSHT